MQDFVKNILLRCNRKVVLGILVCAVAAFLVYFVFSDTNRNHIRVTVISVSEKTDAYSIEAEYPQFTGVSKAFNKKIEDSVLTQIEDFKKNVLDSAEVEPKNKKSKNETYMFRAGWVPDQISGTVVSVLIRQYSFVGGVHGAHSIESFSYDVKKKREITLADIFSDTAGYLDRISQYSMNDIKNQLGSEAVMDMIREGTTPKPENFAVFTLSRDNMITFYFPEYQTAPYASGEQKVVMPISFIKAIPQ